MFDVGLYTLLTHSQRQGFQYMFHINQTEKSGYLPLKSQCNNSIAN